MFVFFPAKLGRRWRQWGRGFLHLSDRVSELRHGIEDSNENVLLGNPALRRCLWQRFRTRFADPCH